MGLVEDHRRRFRQHARIRRRLGLLLDGQIGEEEMMVHDDHIAFERAPAHLGDEAPLIIGTALPQAGLAARIELGPHLARFGQRVDLGPVPGLGRLLPGRDLLKLVDLFQSVQNRLVAQGIQLVGGRDSSPGPSCSRRAAVPASDSRKGTSRKKSCSCRFLVPVEMITRCPVRKAGKQVGERLARPGARFDDQVFALLQAAFDRPRHLQLPAAELVGQRGAREHSSGGEEVVQRRQRLSGDGGSGQGRGSGGVEGQLSAA